jgi:hypothetical protein
MALLWVKVGGSGDDPMPPEFLAHEHYRHLREHLEDQPSGADPKAHDHFTPLNYGDWSRSRGKSYRGGFAQVPHTTHPGALCTGYGPGECGHPPTVQHMREIAESDWEGEQTKLHRPEEHERRQQEADHLFDSFLSDYSLEHPDRVHKIGPNGELLPPDDPRLTGR